MSSKGFFPSLVVPTWHGFIGPKVKKAASGTQLTVTPAGFTGGTTFGNGGSPFSLAFNTDIYAVHTMLNPDPGSGVGSSSPSSVSGHPIVAILNLKVGSPINPYIIFSGSFSVPGGVTVTYTDNLNAVHTVTPVLVDLSVQLGAGFSSWQLPGNPYKGTSSTTPFNIQFNGI